MWRGNKGYKLTTIVYNHKKNEIAVDGRVTNEGTILTDSHDKSHTSGDRVYFLTGNISDHPRVIEILDKYENGDKVTVGSEIKASVVFAQGGAAYIGAIDPAGDVWISKVEFNDGGGSGHHWALAALDHGLTTRQAVKYASERDAFTGGKIQVFNVTKHKFN